MKKTKIIIGLFGLILLSGCCSLKVLYGVCDNDCENAIRCVPQLTKFEKLLDSDGLKLDCSQYEQIGVLRYNLTCDNICWNVIRCRTHIEISERKECQSGLEPIKSDAISTYIDGDCLRYDIIKK